jgi:hypothetical protein
LFKLMLCDVHHSIPTRMFIDDVYLFDDLDDATIRVSVVASSGAIAATTDDGDIQGQ